MQIFPTPVKESYSDGEFILPKTIFLKANSIANTSFLRLAKDLTNTFFCGIAELRFVESDKCPFGTAVIESADGIDGNTFDTDIETDGMSYVLDISEKKISIKYASENDLIHAFMSFIMSFEMKAPGQYVSACRRIEDRAAIGFRGVHLCVFPETTLDFLKKCVRVCGMLKYTHIVIEFWGMYKYSFTDALSWDNAYTKEELLPIIEDIKGFGAEPVPMLNFMGHASQSRVMGGKHVTLDRYPECEYLFESDGWTWRVDRQETIEFLEKAAAELCDLFGKGDYFHFGCDEVYSIMERPDQAEFLEKHLERINAISEKLGRRPLIWGDMLIDSERAYAERGAKDLDLTPGLLTHKALPNISKRFALCDWQYSIKSGKISSAEQFLENGFDTLLCPWINRENMRFLCREASKMSCMGILMTTWHKIMENFGAFAECADYMWSPDTKCKRSAYQTVCATLVRKLVPASDYSTSGWQKDQLSFN